MKISIESRLDEVRSSLDKVVAESKWLELDILRALGRGVVREAKAAYKTMFRKRTGEFYRAIKAKTSKDKHAVYVLSDATNPKTNARYPIVLARGVTIKAKRVKMLTFGIDGKWVRRKAVSLPARDWLEGPGKRYLDSPASSADIEKVIQKTIDKLRAKGVLE